MVEKWMYIVQLINLAVYNNNNNNIVQLTYTL